MGTKYFQDVKCPICGHTDKEVLYAPTSGQMTHECSNCAFVIDLQEVVGISPEGASNKQQIANLVEQARANPELLHDKRDEPDIR